MTIRYVNFLRKLEHLQQFGKNCTDLKKKSQLWYFRNWKPLFFRANIWMNSFVDPVPPPPLLQQFQIRTNKKWSICTHSSLCEEKINKFFNTFFRPYFSLPFFFFLQEFCFYVKSNRSERNEDKILKKIPVNITIICIFQHIVAALFIEKKMNFGKFCIQLKIFLIRIILKKNTQLTS